MHPSPKLDWTIEELLLRRPDAARILTGHSMACVGCAMAPFETIAQAAREYHLDASALLSEFSTGSRTGRRARHAARAGRSAGARLGRPRKRRVAGEAAS